MKIVTGQIENCSTEIHISDFNFNITENIDFGFLYYRL
jgi:hypothetical protein